MAGQHATLISEVPARRGHTVTWTIDPSTTRHHLIHIVDRDMVLDNARIRMEGANPGALTGTIGKAASGNQLADNGIALSDATAVTDTFDFESNYTKTNYDLSFVTLKGVPTENVIPAGSAITLNFGWAPDASLGLVTVVLRLSDRL